MRSKILGSALAVMLAPVSAFAQDSAAVFGDAERGAEVFDQCSACHQIGPGAENAIGPHLNGIFGRRAGSVADFPYSKGLIREGNDGLMWDLRRLDAYLENPKALSSDARMSFEVPEQQDRNDVLAYLRRFSDTPQDIPGSAPTARAPEVELPPEILSIVGDVAYGEYLASECTTCHQTDGTDQGIPSITRWPVEDFVVAMHAYKIKIRPHPVMQMMAGRLSDEEIAALAAYFRELE